MMMRGDEVMRCDEGELTKAWRVSSRAGFDIQHPIVGMGFDIQVAPSMYEFLPSSTGVGGLIVTPCF